MGILFYEILLLSQNNIINKNCLGFIFFNNNSNVAILWGILGFYFVSLEKILFSLKWQEREVQEFLGINFLNKFDNRNLFLWFGINGNPLKKLFPVIGFWGIDLFEDNSLVLSRSMVI